VIHRTGEGIGNVCLEMTDGTQKNSVDQRGRHRSSSYRQRDGEATDHTNVAHRVERGRGNTQAIAWRSSHRRTGVGRPEESTTQTHQAKRDS